MKTIVAAAFFAVCSVFSASGQAPCKEYTIPGSVMAFCPPANWTAKREPGKKYSTFTDPAASANASLSVAEDVIAINRESYAFIVMKKLLEPDEVKTKSIADVRDFQTTSGLQGTKLVFLFEMGGVPLRSAIYYFEAPNDIKLTFSFTSVADEADIDTVLDRSMKTFRLKKLPGAKTTRQ